MLQRLAAIAFVAVALGPLACVTNVDRNEPAPAAQYADGLTIVESDASIGKLIAVFKKDGRAVTFHLRQGEKMPVDAPADPTSRPSYQIDARISDQEGRAMGTQMGGDEFIDPSWHMEGSKGVDAAQRITDFAIAYAALDAFVAWQPPPGLEQLRLGAIDVARRSNPALNARTEEAATPTPGTVTGESGPALGAKTEKPTSASIVYGVTGDPYAYYDWTYSIYWDDVSGPVGEHSSVRLRLYRDNYTTLLQWWDACNHGRCAEGDGMARACTSARMRDSNDTRYFYGESSRSMTTSNGGCTNRYDPVPDWWGGSHNCHNDTRLQRYAIATGSVGSESRSGDYGSLCAQSDVNAPKTCPTTF
jgi:hypothetical protein